MHAEECSEQRERRQKERVAAAADVQKQREHASGESRERVKAMLIELAELVSAQPKTSWQHRSKEMTKKWRSKVTSEVH